MPRMPLPAVMTRRAVAAALLLGGAVAACSSEGSAAGRNSPASDGAAHGSPPPAETELVSLRVTGGFAGVDRSISVRTDGGYTVTGRRIQERTGRLPDSRLAELRRLLAQARIDRLPPRAIDPHLRDGFHYRVAYGDHVVVTDLSDPVEPLAAAIALLEQVMSGKGSG